MDVKCSPRFARLEQEIWQDLKGELEKEGREP
jgi:hypothetical protein